MVLGLQAAFLASSRAAFISVISCSFRPVILIASTQRQGMYPSRLACILNFSTK
ncbi:hypothetical protein L798_06083 [Zootermopsis nevadensis]|uniref:Uncharacterized protein n=1 Tax=Zootermopsis nevadensis TaxID=136037 RepID=A0A067R7G0_ZOONE|nr:hypothetical protein L798_06083 [Zootermopsis nevadensis]